MADFKKLSAVDTVETVSQSTNVLIEEKGIIKKVAKDTLKGATSWNDLEDKPFYEETKVVNEPLNITWDGNKEGLLCAADLYYKVSDLILTEEQLINATFRRSYGDSFTVNEWCHLGPDDAILSTGEEGPDIVIVNSPNADWAGWVFPETGIYFQYWPYGGTFYIESFTTAGPIEYSKTTVKKLDPKFLPDNTGGVSASGLNPFIIKADFNGNDGPVIDKTWDEVREAYHRGDVVLLIGNDGSIYTISGEDDYDNIRFHTLWIGDDQKLRSYIFSIAPDGTCTNTFLKLS